MSTPTTPVSPATFLPGVKGDTTKILVGESTTFKVHDNVLQQSPFFANALKPEWVAARAGKPIDLKEEDPDTFFDYAQWLYSHNIDITVHSNKWAKLYVIGEKLMDAAFQNKVIDTMAQECEAIQIYPGIWETNFIYNGTAEGSPMRRLLVDFYAQCARLEWIRGQISVKKAHEDFIDDLLQALVVQRKPRHEGKKAWITNIGKYHVKAKTTDK